MDTSGQNAFDNLVAGLTQEERTAMLSRLNTPDMENVEFPEDTKKIDNFNGTLVLRLKDESFFYKVILWFRSIFSKTSVQSIYNNDVLSSLARKINREHPGLIDPRAQLLDTMFYEQLIDLKSAADFFRPYFFKIDEDPGAFYVFLGSFIAPQISEQINTKVDPYNLSSVDEPTNEVRNSLLRELDEILKNIPTASKNIMYNGVKSVQWLKSFVNLPYIHFLAQFTDIKTNVFTCPLINAKIDYDAFASVFDSKQSISNEILESIFLFSQKKDLTSQYSDSDIEQAIKKFMAVATNHFSTIKLFLSTIPITTMGKIVFSDYDWSPKPTGGGEDWFAKFRAQWRKVFDIRWADFVRDRKKSLLAHKLRVDFDLESFPESPLTSWKSFWGGKPINFEMTSGFLTWYCTEKYPKAKKILTMLLMEGIFIKNDNRTEFSEALDILDTAANDMGIFIEKINYDGEYGSFFAELEGHSLRSLNTQNNIENLIKKIDLEVKDITDRICKSIRIAETVFKGIFEDSNDGYHASIQNLNILKGYKTAKLKDEIISVRHDLNQVLYYLSEFEPIDNPS